MIDYPAERDSILESLEAIDEQLAALPHKTDEVKDQLMTLAQAKRVKYPIPNLYAKVWTSDGQHVQEARSILSALGLDPNFGRYIEPGTTHSLTVTVEPLGKLTLYGTVNDEGQMTVLDVVRDDETLDRDVWMGRYHNLFALLVVKDLREQQAAEATS